MASAIDQHHELDRCRPAVIKDLVERGADGATGMEHVVDQDDMPVFHIEWQVGGFYLWVQADAREIVAVKGYVECA